MAESPFPHLSAAPIVEASIEIRAQFENPVPDPLYTVFARRMNADYPHQQLIRFFAPTLDFAGSQAKASMLEQSIVGTRLESKNKLGVVQAKRDGLTVSRLQPYESWTTLIAEVMHLWREYVSVFCPTTVIRLGTRYINRIALPIEGTVDFDDVFAAGPVVPLTLPQGLVQFSTRLVIPFEDRNAILVIAQQFDPSPPNVPSAVVLDLDASTNTLMEPGADAIWRQLEILRQIKNEAFFGSLTKNTWEKYL